MKDEGTAMGGFRALSTAKEPAGQRTALRAFNAKDTKEGQKEKYWSKFASHESGVSTSTRSSSYRNRLSE